VSRTGGHENANRRSPKGKILSHTDKKVKDRYGRRSIDKHGRKRHIKETKIHKEPKNTRKELTRNEYEIVRILHSRKQYYPGYTIEDLSREYLPEGTDYNVEYHINSISNKKDGWIVRDNRNIFINPEFRVEIEYYLIWYRGEFIK